MDIPIIFSAPMVLALLDGRKTMTRRIPTPQWRKVAPGDRLWVRENYYKTDDGDHETAVYAADEHAAAHHINEIELLATQHDLGDEWKRPHLKLRPCIHMPRWASRLTLVVTATKIEPLQAISEEEAKAEGAVLMGNGFWSCAPGDGPASHSPVSAFAGFWKSLHGPTSWDANPEVVALTFTVHKVNIDQFPSPPSERRG